MQPMHIQSKVGHQLNWTLRALRGNQYYYLKKWSIYIDDHKICSDLKTTYLCARHEGLLSPTGKTQQGVVFGCGLGNHRDGNEI
jgi:hypothetical protein